MPPKCDRYKAPTYGTRCRQCFQLAEMHELAANDPRKSEVILTPVHRLAEFPMSGGEAIAEEQPLFETLTNSIRRVVERKLSGTSFNHAVKHPAVLPSPKLNFDLQQLDEGTAVLTATSAHSAASMRSLQRSVSSDGTSRSGRLPIPRERTWTAFNRSQEDTDSSSTSDDIVDQAGILAQPTASSSGQIGGDALCLEEGTSSSHPTASPSSQSFAASDEAISMKPSRTKPSILSAIWRTSKVPVACPKCLVTFGWKTRRHRCRVCADYRCESCCRRTLIPKAIPLHSDLKNADKRLPQWVCQECLSDVTRKQRTASEDSEIKSFERVRHQSKLIACGSRS